MFLLFPPYTVVPFLKFFQASQLSVFFVDRAEVEVVPCADLYHDRIGKYSEIALEKQAQFIGRHEAEEKAHEEGENFRGNNNCILVCPSQLLTCDHHHILSL